MSPRYATPRLTPAQKRVLDVLLNKESAAETSAEIAAELGYTTATVNNMLSEVYAFYGVKSARGLFRRLDTISEELGTSSVSYRAK